MLDLNVLKKGKDYETLKDSYVIFICTFDPFGEDLCCYNYENTCRDGKRRFLKDGRNILFFNTKGTINNVSKEVQAMLKYMETGDATDEITRSIDNEVEQMHFDGAALADYLIRQMQQRERDMAAEQRGMKKGRKEGMKEGREEGKISMLKQLVDSGDISLEVAAKRMGVKVEEIEEMIKEK